ncbi:MAG: DNA-processing protein DprA [Eubacteriales bacterium]|nr:DNA-processing protein DprA [Eubacteriales bacterium]
MNKRTKKINNKIDIQNVNYGSINYPKRLSLLSDAPKTIYYKGTLPRDDYPTVGIVGSRTASEYGIKLAKSIAMTLSKKNIQVISGMALGIDSAAHIGAIEVNKANYAILGCGVNICYPAYNYNIYEKIIDLKGGIISEYPNDTPPLYYNFPIRNRIIAGFSDVLIIVEARHNSGSLITAEYMLKQGKDIFAIPGRIGDAISCGTNDLIKQGAYIFTCVEDVLDYLGVKNNKKIPIEDIKKKDLDYFEKIVYSKLTNNSSHIDEIMELCKLPIEICLQTLMSLQIEGLVEQPMNGYYRKI